MNCPHCRDTTLVMADRAGIEIDYCPKCRGVWLDRGELDKIIERSSGAAARRYDDDDDDDDRRQASYDPHRHPKKKKGFLREIFDFD